MKYLLATVFFFVLGFIALLNEIMIAEIEYKRNYSFTPSLWQRINTPHRECPDGEIYYECNKRYLKKRM